MHNVCSLHLCLQLICIIFLNILAEKLSSLSVKDQERHCASLVDSLSSPDRGPLSNKYVQLLHYGGTIGGVSKFADILVQHNILLVLAHNAKEAQQIEM